MKVDLGIWGKLTQLVIVLVVIAILLLIGMTYLPLIQQNERMRADILKLENQQQQLMSIQRQMQTDMNELRNDPKTVERLAREKLGYAKPDETVVHFESAN